MYDRLEHPSKVLLFSEVIFFGIETTGRLEQFENAEAPRTVKLSGIDILDNKAHSEKAESPIEIKPDGIY